MRKISVIEFINGSKVECVPSSDTKRSRIKSFVLPIYKEYICVESFSVPLMDGMGFSTDIEKIIEKDSIWFFPEDEDYRFIGGQVRLESENLDWMEITEKSFKEYFREEK